MQDIRDPVLPAVGVGEELLDRRLDVLGVPELAVVK